MLRTRITQNVFFFFDFRYRGPGSPKLVPRIAQSTNSAFGAPVSLLEVACLQFSVTLRTCQFSVLISRPIDYDHDGKLNLEEFRNGAYDIYKNYVEFESGGANVPSPEEMFETLDVKKDKYVNLSSFRPHFDRGDLT